MKDNKIEALVARLNAWSPLVASGYECPAAGQAMCDAGRALTSLKAERDRLEKERDAQKHRGDNHAETLRGVRKWIRENDIERALLWISDGLSGYTDTAEKTLCEAIARAETAERERDEARAEVERLRSERSYIVGFNDGFEEAKSQEAGNAEA